MKKGFTLVELAIVLVVIGILMGMVIKGKSILDAAKMRAELAGITKISNAVNTYFTKFDRLPIPKVTGVSSDIVFQTLIDQGLLTAADKRTRYGHQWVMVGCSIGTGSSTMYTLSNIQSNTRLCLYRASAPMGSPSGDLANNTMDGNLVCNIEVSMDDRSVTAGRGRQAGSTISGGVASSMNCNDKAVISQTDVPYVFSLR